MSDARDFDDELDDDLLDEEAIGDDAADLDDEESRIDRTRADYTGVDLGDEFQPVDAVELSEEGMLFDDPERITEDTERAPREIDPDDVGWDLDKD